jgi:hypothetical protein
MLHIKAKFLNLIQPAGEKPVYVPFGAEPRDCLVVRAKRKVGSDAGRARGPTAQKVVAKDPQGMDDRQQLEDVSWICLLCRREFAAFVGDRVVMAVVVGLRQDRRDGLLTSIRREDGAPTRVEGAQDRGRRQARLQPVKALLLLGTPCPGRVRPAKASQRRRNVGICVHEAAVVVAESDEPTQVYAGGRDWPLLHRRDLARIHGHPGRRDPVAQKAKLLSSELAL